MVPRSLSILFAYAFKDVPTFSIFHIYTARAELGRLRKLNSHISSMAETVHNEVV